MIRGIEMRDLGQCMDPRIGAAGSLQSQRFLGGFREGPVQMVLDGVVPGLGLPAFKGASVVGDGEFETHFLESNV